MSTYKLDSPMSWAEFSRMPDDLKVRYINNLRELYGATDRMFSEMFGIHFTHFSRIRAGLGVTSRMPRTRDDEIKHRAKAWNAFRNGVANDEAPVEEPVSEETVAEEHVSEEAEFSPEECAEEVVVPSFVLKEEVIKPLSLDELTAVFTGVFGPTAFLQWLAQLPIPEDSVRIKVEVTRQ